MCWLGCFAVRGLLGRRPVCPALRSGLMKVACAVSRSLKEELLAHNFKARALKANGFVDLPEGLSFGIHKGFGILAP